ncbi:peptidoglycan DD-metalloendopeptidase family protein [bacterium]|nr:peptidoglycan DD-metalloendopeptidase family protein [bacterium]
MRLTYPVLAIGWILAMAIGDGVVCKADSIALDSSISPIEGSWGFKDVTCSLRGREFRGIGYPQPSWSNGFACFNITGYARFQAFAAIQEGSGCRATLIVALDGAVVWQKQMQDGDPVVPLDVALSGHRVMRLERRMQGDGADFLEPRLIRGNPVPNPSQPGPRYPLDGLSTPDQIMASVLGQGRWLYGLPNYPRYNGSQVHAAIDIRSTLGAPVFAITEGTVDPNTGMHSGFGPGWTTGGVIVIGSLGDNGLPYYIIYGHTQPPTLKVNSHVAAGDTIGHIGPWLEQDGEPHLHLSVRLRPLPLQGWGTPNATGHAGKTGCEYAGSPQDLIELGYRDPMTLFNGQLQAEMHVGSGLPDPVRDKLLARYRAGYYPDLAVNNLDPVPQATNHIGRPANDAHIAAAQASRVGAGYLQTFQRHDGQFTALALSDAAAPAFWIHGAVWATYASGGGPNTLGYPRSEEYSVPEGRAQRFEKATLIFSTVSGLTDIHW